MTFKRSGPAGASAGERRSGLNRRWIRAPYDGVERRSGNDRRGLSAPLESPSPGTSAAERTESLEKLVLSTTVRLEALARLLVDKGVLSHEELAEMLRSMQAEYQHSQVRED
jgi:hypothetical protein